MTLELIKDVHREGLYWKKVYRHRKYVIEITKTSEGLEYTAHLAGDKSGCIAPKADLYEDHFYISFAFFRGTNIQNLPELIDNLNEIQEISDLLPELIKLGEEIGDV